MFIFGLSYKMYFLNFLILSYVPCSRLYHATPCIGDVYTMDALVLSLVKFESREDYLVRATGDSTF